MQRKCVKRTEQNYNPKKKKKKKKRCCREINDKRATFAKYDNVKVGRDDKRNACVQARENERRKKETRK